MTVYSVESGFCFAPRVTLYTDELRSACDARGIMVEGFLAPFDDGSYWGDVDGVTLVGWLEPDGVTYYPPLEAVAGVNL